ncbi:MAG TPA: hypothetical protein VIC84_25470 [Blastocatellia bacterium]|jgi:hypothetical protein
MAHNIKAQFARLAAGLIVSLMAATVCFSNDGGKKQSLPASPTHAENSTGEETRTHQAQLTPQDQAQLAEIHRRKAAQFRQEAAEDQKKLEKESRSFVRCPKCEPSLRLIRMTAKYKSLIREAEANADEQDRLAQYHLLLAKDMQEHQ